MPSQTYLPGRAAGQRQNLVLAVVTVFCGLLVASQANAQQIRLPAPAHSALDPRLAKLRAAASGWKQRTANERQVIDQVCLVADERAFYDALATWTDTTFFPILIDDVDLTLKFLQAFRPARVVRFPKRTAADSPAGDHWSVAERVANSSPKLRDTSGPPGLVIANQHSPSLPGLTALAKGRFQRLVQQGSAQNHIDTLTPPQMSTFLASITTVVRSTVPQCEQLGDDCDFLTLAGDFPYRYQGDKSVLAVDDLIGRSPITGERWAFTGRLMGDARQSVYAAMCSLFLQPATALTFNSYPEDSAPWNGYSLQLAADHLRLLMPTKQQSGAAEAGVQGWHRAFDPTNRFGLLMINTKGSPRVFDLQGGSAHAFDIMPSGPVAVCIIHSFSAAEPWNADTIAGRWLAQGAFLYHGAMDEPFLNSFRPPALTAELLESGIPFSAALRPLRDEPFGEPWKLVVLGDPLYALRSNASAPARSRKYGDTAGWAEYRRGPLPDVRNTEAARLGWAVTATFARFTADSPRNAESVLPVLLGIKRANLAPASRQVLDVITAEVAYQERKFAELKLVYAAIPREERSPTVTRLALAAFLTDFSQAIANQSFDKAVTNWNVLLALTSDGEFKRLITRRLGTVADAGKHSERWLALLKKTRANASDANTSAALDEEIKRQTEQVKPPK